MPSSLPPITSISSSRTGKCPLNAAGILEAAVWVRAGSSIMEGKFFCLIDDQGNPLGTLSVDHGTANLVGRDQVTINYYPSGPENANRQPGLLQCINDAPIDLLSVHFTGRGKEFEFLKQALNNRPNNLPSRCAVHGMPGLGKTQLLLQYAKLAFENRWYTHIFWTSATTVEKLNQGFANVLDLVDDHSRSLQEQSAKLTSARRWLEGSHGNSDIDWLLVVDNVHRDVLSFLRSHLPRSGTRGSILFSTRTAEVAGALTKAAGVEYPTLALQTLDVREAANLLVEDAGFTSEITTPSLLNQAEALVNCVGRLPLAVVQAATFIKQTGTTLGDMFKLYNSEQKMQVIQWESDLNAYEERSVAATFSKLLNRLNHESHDISNLLKVLAFLDPENIPVKMVVEGAKRLVNAQNSGSFADPLPAFSTSSSSSPPSLPKLTPLRRLKKWGKLRWPMHGGTKTGTDDMIPASRIPPESSSLISLIISPIEFQKAIQKFTNLSLVEHRPNIGDSSLRMHDLAQFMMRESARTEGTYQKWIQLSVSLVCCAFQHIEDHTLPQSWPECEKFVPHLRSLNEAWDDTYGWNEELTVAKGNIATYLHHRGRYDEAAELLKHALEVTKKYLGADHPSTPASMNDLASVYMSQGRYDEAETLYKQALAGGKKLLGTDHPSTLTSMNNLASAYKSQGRYDEAETLHKQELASTQKLLGADHLDTLDSMSDLASVYVSQGRYDEAESLHKQALAGRQKALGADHLFTLISMNNLALVYMSQGRYDEAEKLHKQVLSSKQKLLGADHPSTLTSINNLASVYMSQGWCDEAEILHKQALASHQKALGDDHPSTLASMNHLALVYKSQGRYDEAETLHQQALAGYQKALGADHQFTLVSMNNLASVYKSQGRYDEAETLHNQALAGYQKALGAEHPDTLVSMHNLASVYKSQGRYDEAEILHKQTLAGYQKALGADHQFTLISMNNLALLHMSQGRYDGAETLHKQVLASRQKLLGAEHPDTLVSIHNLASVYMSQGRYDEAETLLKQALAGRQKLLGADHPSTLTSINDLVSVYKLQKRYDEAAAMYKAVLAGSEKGLASGHPYTQDTTPDLAYLSWPQEQDSEGDLNKDEVNGGLGTDLFHFAIGWLSVIIFIYVL